MRQVVSRVEGAAGEHNPMLPGRHGAAPAEDDRQVESKWAWCKRGGAECWAWCKGCWGVSVEGLKGCCSCCCSGIWTFLGCFGCCARAGSTLMGWCGPRCPLSKKWSLPKKALADFLDSMATVGVMGILSLNIYCATYFVAWAPKGSICISKAFNTWAKVIVVCLPFTLFPLTLYIAGQAKALQNDLRGIGLVAGAVLLEIVYVLSMGGLMTVCMSARPWLPVVLVTGFLSLLLVTACGCCCYSPKWLRRCLSCICCWGCLCEEIDEEAAVEV